MRFYHQSYRELMEMPLRFFWALNSKIGALRAEEQLGEVDLALVGSMNTSGEMIQQFIASKKEAMGTPVIVTEHISLEEHQEGLSKLTSILKG